MVRFIIFFGTLLLMSCDCEELTLEREPFNGNQLRMNGFYAAKLDRFNPSHTSIYVLYHNGIIFYAGGVEEANTQKLYSYMSDNSNYSPHRDSKTSWGVFVVNQSDITIEKWFSGSGRCAPVAQLKGRITSDTSFILDKYNEEYIFYEHYPKPDSTNIFIN